MRMARKLGVFLVIACVVGVLTGLGFTSILAHDQGVEIRRHNGTIRIVTEDEDGNRQERTIEYDDDEPRAFLGVSTDEADDGGVVVTEVFDGTAAERAGLQKGDVIVGLDGRSIESSWDLLQGVLELQPGDRTAVELLRDGQREVVDVELGEREPFDFDFDFDFDFSGLENLEGLGKHLEGLDVHLEDLREQLEGLDIDMNMSMPNLRFLDHHSPSRPKLGVQLVQPTAELRRHFGAPPDAGVIVAKVMDDMPAEDAGIEVGDMIVSADGREIKDTGDLLDVLRDSDGESIDLELIRDGVSLRLDVFIPLDTEE